MAEDQAQMGEEVMKEAAASLASQAEAEMAFAEQIAQAGAGEAAKLLQQAAQLKMQALQAMGVTGGGESKGRMPQSPDVAGTGAVPADQRMG